MTTQCIFPTELICKILSYTSPLDVVRWRTASKLFCTITHDPEIWKAFCVNAPFLRPPGPFPTVPFERAFMQSARLAQTWTTQGLRTVSRVSVPFDGWVTKDLHLVGGRWLVVCQLNRRFVLYDTNANAGMRAPQVIWEQGEEIISWKKCLATSEEGQWVIHVLFRTDDPPRWTLLEFRLNAETGALCDTVTLDVPVSDVKRNLEFDGGQKLFARSPFLTLPNQNLVFDTRTRVFYEFPDLCIALDTTRSWPLDPGEDNIIGIVPTKTHVLLLRDLTVDWLDYCIVVQAFTVPDDPRPAKNGKGVLRLSHEGIFSSDYTVIAVIRNSVVDPITGTTNVKLLERHWNSHDFQPICIDLTLDKPSPDGVSPITIDRHYVSIEGGVSNRDRLGFCQEYYDISDDGYARGLFTRDPTCIATEGCGVVKFTIDATRDPCVAVLSPFSGVDQDSEVFPIIEECRASKRRILSGEFSPFKNTRMLLDGVRGRFSYVDHKGSNDQAIVVLGIE